MTDEKIQPLIGKTVEIVFIDDTKEVGILLTGSRFFGKWQGKGYHIEGIHGSVGFKKSHVKKIREVIK